MRRLLLLLALILIPAVSWGQSAGTPQGRAPLCAKSLLQAGTCQMPVEGYRATITDGCAGDAPNRCTGVSTCAGSEQNVRCAYQEGVWQEWMGGSGGGAPGTGTGTHHVTATPPVGTSAVCAEWDGSGNLVEAVSGQACGAGGGTPGGTTFQMQFNAPGDTFGGTTGLTWNDAGQMLTGNEFRATGKFDGQGTVLLPFISVANDRDTGLYECGTGGLCYTRDGVDQGELNSGGGGGGSPGGVDTSVQYRVNATTFGGEAGFTYGTGRLDVPTSIFVGGDQVTVNPGSADIDCADVGTPSNYTPANGTCQGHFQGIDTALGSAGGGGKSVSEVFRIQISSPPTSVCWRNDSTGAPVSCVTPNTAFPVPTGAALSLFECRHDTSSVWADGDGVEVCVIQVGSDRLQKTCVAGSNLVFNGLAGTKIDTYRFAPATPVPITDGVGGWLGVLTVQTTAGAPAGLRAACTVEVTY